MLSQQFKRLAGPALIVGALLWVAATTASIIASREPSSLPRSDGFGFLQNYDPTNPQDHQLNCIDLKL